MFKLCSALAIGCNRGPVVIPHFVLPSAQANHGLNSECHTWSHNHVVTRVVVVQHLNVGMKEFADAMANKCTNYTHSVQFGVSLNGFANVADGATRHNCLNAFPHALFSNKCQKFALFINFANKESCIGVAMHAVHVTRNVEVDDVAVVHNSGVGNAVADDFIQTCAHTLGVVVIVQRAWVCPTLNCFFVHKYINVICGHAGLHKVSGQLQNFCSHVAGITHALNNFWRLHASFLGARHFTGVGVWRFSNTVWHCSHGAHNPGKDLPLERFMAALVLAPTAAPARVASNRKHGGGSLTAHNVPRLLGINGGIAFFLLPWSDTNFTHRGCG